VLGSSCFGSSRRIRSSLTPCAAGECYPRSVHLHIFYRRPLCRNLTPDLSESVDARSCEADADGCANDQAFGTCGSTSGATYDGLLERSLNLAPMAYLVKPDASVKHPCVFAWYFNGYRDVGGHSFIGRHVNNHQAVPCRQLSLPYPFYSYLVLLIRGLCKGPYHFLYVSMLRSGRGAWRGTFHMVPNYPASTTLANEALQNCLYSYAGAVSTRGFSCPYEVVSQSPWESSIRMRRTTW
jgi:hypothetical protein